MSRYVASPTTTVSVSTSSTAIVGTNMGRNELTIVNDSANVIYLGFATTAGGTATAVGSAGVRLNANGGSWSTTRYKGPVAGINATGASAVTVFEV